LEKREVVSYNPIRWKSQGVLATSANRRGQKGISIQEVQIQEEAKGGRKDITVRTP